jgi:predicted transcriptional regulator
MARKKTPTLTGSELKLMNVVWEKGETTVHDILEALPAIERPAYNTVLTIMRILEHKGYLAHTKDGRAHLYRPLVDRHEARQSAVKHIVSSFFDNSPGLLVQNILDDDKITADELARLKKMIEESEC